MSPLLSIGRGVIKGSGHFAYFCCTKLALNFQFGARSLWAFSPPKFPRRCP